MKRERGSRQWSTIKCYRAFRGVGLDGFRPLPTTDGGDEQKQNGDEKNEGNMSCQIPFCEIKGMLW